MPAESVVAFERNPLQDQCGIIGVFSSQGLLFDVGLEALKWLQTRGYDGAGFTALRNDGTVLIHKKQGTINEVFIPGVVDRLKKVPFYNAQLQTRYGTDGEYSDENTQPLIIRHKASNEIFMVSHNGQFSKNHTDQKGYESDTVKFVQRLATSEGANWDERIKNILTNQKGAWSLIIGTKDSMYLTRDPLGIRPLYFAQRQQEDGSFLTVAASETVALQEIGFEKYFEVLPGQLVRFDRDTGGFSVLQIHESRKPRHCIFENVYTLDENGHAFLPRGSMTEVNNSQTVLEVRQRCGERLAQEAPFTQDQIDIIVGVPGTGIAGGKAFAKALGLEHLYKQVIKDKNTPGSEQRTFMQADIDGILKKVLKHFDFDIEELRGKRVVLVDDSLVRGNISRGLVKLLKEYCGVLEVHFRILSPPIDDACFLGINTRTQSELIAAKHSNNGQNYVQMVESIREEIGADSLAYLSDEGLLYATSGDPHDDHFCMGCMFRKKAPIDKYGNYTAEVDGAHNLILENEIA